MAHSASPHGLLLIVNYYSYFLNFPSCAADFYLNSFSLDNFRVGPNRGEKMTLQPSVNLALNFDKAQRKWRFAIFQAHAQSNNVTLSLNARYEYGLTVTGLDIALLFPLPIADISYPFYLRSDNNHSSYRADVIAVPYEDGGEFNQNKE